MDKRILFVGHEASRTGAPIMLLHLLEWLRSRGGYDCRLLLLRDGPLAAAYERVLPTAVLPGAIPPPDPRLPPSPPTPDDLRRSALLRELAEWKPDLLYINAVRGLLAQPTLAALGCPLLVHVHELDLSLRASVSVPLFAKVRAQFPRYIAASEAVRTMLLRAYGVPAQHVTLAYEGIPGELPPDLAISAASVRSMLKIPDDAVVVGMAGTMDWRKGFDFFVDLARRVLQSVSKDVHFLWVGGSDEEDVTIRLWQSAFSFPPEQATRVHLVGEQIDPFPFLQAMDIFTLTSREDPFPLVHLEAALVGKPILCFRGSGGAEEWIEPDAGRVVPFGDTQAMATETLRLIDDAALRRQLGETARRIVRGRFLIEHVAPRMEEAMRDAMGAGLRPAGRAL